MASWYVDKGLAVLIKQMKAKNPGMTVGTIGDAKHAARTSDHNPKANGCVCAGDFMIPSGGRFTAAEAAAFVKALAAAKDSRLKYVIYNRKIFSKRNGVWAWRTYSGSDPHTNHVHVSVYESSKTSAWSVGGNSPAPSKPTIREKAPAFPLKSDQYYGLDADTKKEGVEKFQAELRQRGWTIDVDGYFGTGTLKVVRAFQAEKGLDVDGKVGPATWKAIWESPVT